MRRNDGHGNAEGSLAPGLGGDREAFGRIVISQRQAMLRAAGGCLRRRPALKGVYDEEDAVQGGVCALWADVRSGALPPIEDAAGLMRVFGRALACSVAAVAQREGARKRGGRGVRRRRRPGRAGGPTPRPEVRAAGPDELECLASSEPPPDAILMQAETLERLLAAVEPDQREAVDLRCDGLTIPEIRSRLGIPLRTLERALKRVREAWRAIGLMK